MCMYIYIDRCYTNMYIQIEICILKDIYYFSYLSLFLSLYTYTEKERSRNTNRETQFLCNTNFYEVINISIIAAGVLPLFPSLFSPSSFRGHHCSKIFFTILVLPLGLLSMYFNVRRLSLSKILLRFICDVCVHSSFFFFFFNDKFVFPLCY